MSSILEALRELEGSRPRSATERVATVDVPVRSRRLSDALIPIAGGLAVGVVVFGIVVWGSGVRISPRDGAAPSAAVAEGAAPAAERPAWLDTADAPRARIEPAPFGRAVSRRPGTESASVPAQRSEASGPIEVESIRYSPDVTGRAVTLRLNGQRVTLHQRESAAGIEVQLITPDGVYVQRGPEVFLVTPSR